MFFSIGFTPFSVVGGYSKYSPLALGVGRVVCVISFLEGFDSDCFGSDFCDVTVSGSVIFVVVDVDGVKYE